MPFARFAAVFALLVAAAGAPAGAQEGAPPAEPPRIAFRPVVERAVDAVILPGYRELSEQAAAEATLTSDLCWQADVERLGAARAGFRELVLAWSRVELVRFGPARDKNRYERLFFWPDPRGRGLQQIQEIIASDDPTATDVDTLREKSVAVQGLFALEFVLYGTGSDMLADPDDPARSFRCRFGAAIAGAIEKTAEEIDADWTKPDGYAALMRDAGPDNPVYRSHGEAVQELIKSAREQLQLSRDLKLAHAIEDAPGKAQPKRAPFWRSDLTIPSIRANLKAVLALVGPEGIGAALPRDEPWVAAQLAFELGEVDKTLGRVEARAQRWETLVKDAESHADLTYTLIPLADAIALLEGGYPDALGLITGFNSLDGD
jgi:predicted lipoprotein